MPSIETSIEVEVEFEVYCECGEGLCSNTTVRASRNRGTPQLVIEPCPVCLKAAAKEAASDAAIEHQDLIDELKARIKELEINAT